MTVLEKIKSTGGFANFGAIGSMPLGYFLDGSHAQTDEYYEVQRKKAEGKVIKAGEISNEKFHAYLTLQKLNGDLLKLKS